MKIRTILRLNIPPNWRYCMSSCNLLLFDTRAFGLNSAWYHLLNFCKVFLMNCNLVGSCVSTIFCLLHSTFNVWSLHIDNVICIESIFRMHHGWFLCDNHDCVGIQLTFKYFWQSHLYAHVIVNIFWRYVRYMNMEKYESDKVCM